MLSKGPLSLIPQWLRRSVTVGRAGHHRPSSGGVAAPQGQPAETQSAAVHSKVLLFLLLAEQTAVTQKMCAGAEGETQSLALTSAGAILVPDLPCPGVRRGKCGSRAVWLLWFQFSTDRTGCSCTEPRLLLNIAHFSLQVGLHAVKEPI